MKTVKGPAVFLAQFVDDHAPFNSLEGMCKWAADLGYKGIQIPYLHFVFKFRHYGIHDTNKIYPPTKQFVKETEILIY